MNTPDKLSDRIKTAKLLDKFYTKRDTSKQCYDNLIEILLDHDINLKNVIFIEPSAGDGSFLEVINESRKGFDIKPPTINPYKIIQNDFLKTDIIQFLSKNDLKKQTIIIGNPPFGKKSKLAINFLNKSLEYSKIVGFIVPIQFRKWSVQSKIKCDAKLLMDITLDENIFEIVGKTYKVRCCFQVWARNDFSNIIPDLRIIEKPKTSHKDFLLYQYNRTEIAKKYFDYDWDFAVPRQGYLDYELKIYTKKDIVEKNQWIFFKAKNKTILNKLKKIDFVKLSKKNIGIPGFGKADVVEEYTQI